MNPQQSQLAIDLFECGALKFGNFKLKSGIMSPFYVDLRVVISFPKVLKTIATLMWEKVAVEKKNPFDFVCGVPYTALPFATCISMQQDVPMIVKRKEAKDYGTMKLVEGVYEKGQRILVIEDVVTSGVSIFETIEPLEKEGLLVSDVAVLLDREQGGKKHIQSKGYNLISVLTITEVAAILLEKNKIDAEMHHKIIDFVQNNSTAAPVTQAQQAAAAAAAAAATTSSAAAAAAPTAMSMSYADRIPLASNAAAKRVLEVIERKKTNLSFSADVTTTAELLRLTDAVGPHICMLKTHVDVLEDFTFESVVVPLLELARKHDFVIFEDRKFADIGNTVQLQYKSGVYKMADWATIVNAHIIPGPGIIKGLKEVGLSRGHGLLLLAEMSSEGNLATDAYTKKCGEMALQHKDFVAGFIAQHNILPNEPGMLTFTPGVQMQQGGDGLGQQYNTPERVIGECGCDVIIVGRGIYAAADPESAALLYKQAGWSAYLKRTNQ